MPTSSDWLLIVLLPGLFLVLAIVLLVVLAKAFRETTGEDRAAVPGVPPSRARMVWIGLGLGMLAVTVGLAALFLVVWNATRRS
jgi:hypothetical protein